MYTRPLLANGDGIVSSDMPRNSQRSLPSRSYERTLRVPVVTISVRTSFSQTSGVDQLPVSSRSTFQSSLPERLSNAMIFDFVVLS